MKGYKNIFFAKILKDFPVKAIMYDIDDHPGAKTTGGMGILIKISKSIRLAKF